MDPNAVGAGAITRCTVPDNRAEFESAGAGGLRFVHAYGNRFRARYAHTCFARRRPWGVKAVPCA